MSARLSLEAERQLLRQRIERKLRAHESVAEDYAKLKVLTHRELRANVRARKRKAAA